jgi:hypothetical protein
MSAFVTLGIRTKMHVMLKTLPRLRAASICPLLVDTVENSVLRATLKFTKNLVRSCAQSVALASRTELRQEVFS